MVAARKVREKALAVAGHMLEAAAEDLDITGRSIHLKGATGLKISLADVAKASVGVAGAYLPAGLPPGMEVSETFIVNEMAYTNGTAVATVEVDIETGGIKILDYVMVHDCGRIINPMIVDGQIMGGIAHGIGNALFERMHFDAAGQPLTTTLAEYLLPASTEFAGDPASAPRIAVAAQSAGRKGRRRVGRAPHSRGDRWCGRRCLV